MPRFQPLGYVRRILLLISLAPSHLILYKNEAPEISTSNEAAQW